MHASRPHINQFTQRISAQMYFSSLFLSLWLAQRVTAASFYGGYSQSTEYCGVVNIGNDKSNPGIQCQCLSSGEYVACSAAFNDFLVNDGGRLMTGEKYVRSYILWSWNNRTLTSRALRGAAGWSCIGWSLFDNTILAANCSGPTITIVDLG
jgi:hypothetical protein